MAPLAHQYHQRRAPPRAKSGLVTYESSLLEMKCLWEVAFPALTAFEVEKQAVHGATDVKAATRATIQASIASRKLRLLIVTLSLRPKVQLTPLV